MRKDFAIFILTHERPDKQSTLSNLIMQGYTGDWYLVVDDEDKSIDKYIENFGEEKILKFNKQSFINMTDTGQQVPSRACIVYAKNFVEYYVKEFATQYKYYVLADDDITRFRFRYFENDKLKSLVMNHNIDQAFEAYIDFMEKGQFAAISPGTVQYFLVGFDILEPEYVMRRRVCYNFVFRNRDYPVDWKFAMNEDSVTAIQQNKLGQRWLQVPFFQVDIVPISTAPGGMKETYDNMGTYERVMYIVMSSPDSCSVMEYKEEFLLRLNRDNAFAKIISGKYKKEV